MSKVLLCCVVLSLTLSPAYSDEYLRRSKRQQSGTVEANSVAGPSQDSQPRFFGLGLGGSPNPFLDPLSFKEDLLHKKIRFFFSLVPRFPNNPGPFVPTGPYIPPMYAPPVGYPGTMYGAQSPFYPSPQFYPQQGRPPQFFPVVAENEATAAPTNPRPPTASLVAATNKPPAAPPTPTTTTTTTTTAGPAAAAAEEPAAEEASDAGAEEEAAEASRRMKKKPQKL